MPLTPAQATTLRNAVLADPQFNALPPNSDTASAIADYYSTVDPASRQSWDPAAPTTAIKNAVLWTRLTSNEPPSESLAYLGRMLKCTQKQMNLAALLADLTFNAALPNLRAGLEDALTGIPSGASGQNLQAGWPSPPTTGVPLAIQRLALRIEYLLKSAGTGTVPDPITPSYAGTIGWPDVMTAMRW